MQLFKADAAIVHEDDFEELEKGLIYIDRKGGFVALLDPNKTDALLIELERSEQDT